MKDYRPGLENGNDPRRKLVMGVIALVAILAIGLALDFVNHQVNHSEPEPTTQEQTVQEDDGGEDDAVVVTPSADTDDDPDDASDTVEKVGNVSFSSAGNLEGYDDDLKETLASYTEAYLESRDIKATDVTVDVVSKASIDQQGASASLYVLGGDLYLTCTYDPTYKSWAIEGQSGSELRDQLAKKDEEIQSKDSEIAQRDEQIKSKEDELAQKDQEIESLKSQLSDAQAQLGEAQNAYNEVAEMYNQLKDAYESGR